VQRNGVRIPSGVMRHASRYPPMRTVTGVYMILSREIHILYIFWIHLPVTAGIASVSELLDKALP
jgi:hypothetical protein